MILLEDTRNQVGKHKQLNAYLVAQGHKVIRSKMYVGDYMIANDGKVSIDTKSGVLELAQDIFQQHKRFRSECERAKESGIMLYVLIEESVPNGDLAQWMMPRWKTSTPHHRAGEPVAKFRPKTLKAAMQTMKERYGVRFVFCDPSKTGETLMDLLTGGYTADDQERTYETGTRVLYCDLPFV